MTRICAGPAILRSGGERSEEIHVVLHKPIPILLTVQSAASESLKKTCVK